MMNGTPNRRDQSTCSTQLQETESRLDIIAKTMLTINKPDTVPWPQPLMYDSAIGHLDSNVKFWIDKKTEINIIIGSDIHIHVHILTSMHVTMCGI